MSAGILRSWYLSKISKSTSPKEYFVALHDYVLYEFNAFNFNIKDRFRSSL